MSEKIEIPSSKIKLIIMLIGSCIFILLCLKLAKDPEKFITFNHKNVEIIRIVGIVGCALFSSALIYIPLKLLDKKPGLTISEEGITDNSSAVSVGLILWKDIISIKTEQIKSIKFFIVDVKNPDEYIMSKSKLKQMLLKINIQKYGTPITIMCSGLKYDFNKIQQLINDGFEKYKEKPNS